MVLVAPPGDIICLTLGSRTPNTSKTYQLGIDQDNPLLMIPPYYPSPKLDELVSVLPANREVSDVESVAAMAAATVSGGAKPRTTYTRIVDGKDLSQGRINFRKQVLHVCVCVYVYYTPISSKARGVPCLLHRQYA